MARDRLEPQAALETRRLQIPVGGVRYDVEVIERARAAGPDAVTIVLLCHEAFELTRACLDAIERFLFDFALFRPLGISFLPSLPEYDAGDLVTIRLREAGYGTVICDNVANQPVLRDRLPDGHWLKRLPCDIAFDGSGEIFCLHLGRGTLRYSKPGSRQGRQLSLEESLQLVRAHVFRDAVA